MARLLWLPDVLRAAGLNVVENPAWQVRGKDGMRPTVVIGHHTATHWTTPDSNVAKLLAQGRPDLAGPLCHLGLNRDGTFIVIAAGKANHAGAGKWMDANESVETIGIEAYNYGNGAPFPTREPWPQVQLDAYDRGVAALLRHLGRDQRHFCGHREWALPAGRKPDPSGIDLDAMRTRIASLLSREDDDMTLLQARLEVATAWHTKSGEWMTPSPPESAQGRLTRLSLEVHRGDRTVGDIVFHAPQKIGTVVSEPVPSWVLDASVPSP